jgi:hypothetical protein
MERRNRIVAVHSVVPVVWGAIVGCALLSTAAGRGLKDGKDVREWTLADGPSHVTAAFSSCENGTVELLKPDGKPISLQFERLSKSDQVFILKDALPRVDLSAKLLVGKVIGVTDGDTITILDFDKTTSKIRLDGIDAPESSQDFGTQAKKALSEKVFGKYARIEWKEQDRYKRTLGAR